MTTAITGACGEHYVASYLSGFGLIVALPRAGVKGTDLFVADGDLGDALRIQVKTGKHSHGSDKAGEFYSWDTSYSVVERSDPSLWFAYVWLNGWPADNNMPEVFFVPSSVVVSHMKTTQKPETKRAFFWMYADIAEQYRGVNGVNVLRAAMKPNVSKTENCH